MTWKSGIRERLVLHRYENDEYLRLKYLRSPVYRPHFLPKALWWDELSDGIKINPTFLEDINTIENDPEDYPMLVNWRWKDYQNSKFFERLIMIHEIVEYVKKHGWSFIQYPITTLNEDLQSIFSDNIKNYKFKTKHVYRFVSFRGRNRPGLKILKHFMPFGFYGKYQPSYLMDIKSIPNTKRLYRAIRNVISNNYRLEKKSRYKKRYDINYDTILKFMRNKAKNCTKVYKDKIRHVGLYRLLIKDFELSGKTFYDIDPYMGEKSLASFAENCPYYYRPTPPFDEYNDKLAQFLNFEFNISKDGHRHDFTIFDNDHRLDLETYEAVLEELPKKVDTALVFVPNPIIDEITKKYKPDNSYTMRVSKAPHLNGEWLLYNF